MADDKTTNTNTTNNNDDNTSNDAVFEDIFQHIDIDSIIVDPANEVSAKEKNTTTLAESPEQKDTPPSTTQSDPIKNKNSSSQQDPNAPDTTPTKKPTRKRVRKKPKTKEAKEVTKKDDHIQSTVTTEKNTPIQASVSRNIKAKNAPRKEVNNLNIDDISAYIASTKAQQEKKKGVLESLNGTSLTEIPNVYAIVPHVK
jgi:transcriptional regulator with PAS, ATPase and Fis domain